MLSRFQNVDYQAFDTLAFLQLPVPQVSASPPPISVFSDLLFLGFGSVSDVSLRIEELPIESALSKFFADIFPQDIAIGVEDFCNGVPSGSRKCFGFGYDETRLLELDQEAKILHEEEKSESQITHGSETTDIELPKQSDRRTVGEKITQQYEVMQFETPELDVFVETASILENKGIQILSKAPEIGENLDILRPGLATQCPYEVQKSFLLVEDVVFEDPMEQKANLEDDGLFQDQIPLNQIRFPSLEVDETVLESVVGLSVEEKLLSCLQNIELHHTQIDSLDREVEELWGQREYDTTEFLSDNFLSGDSFGSQNGSPNNVPEVDMITLIEISQIRMNYVVQERSGCDHFLPDEPVIFQEFHILDVDSSQIFESLFNRQPMKEPETCSWMFNEDMNFKDFNNLVVSHELTLVDDTFKSLPVPVISDSEKICSFHTIIEGKLANLKAHPESALDRIYLDWHLLEEDKHSCNAYYYKNILGDMVSHIIEFDWDSFDDRNAVYDFVFDDGEHGFTMEENLESKEFLSDVSISSGIHLEVKSSGQFPRSEEQLAGNKSERASLLFKSLSKSSDLDFFLKSQKASLGTNSESTTRSVNNNPVSPKVPLGDSVAATSQGGESNIISDMEDNVKKRKELCDKLSMEAKHSMRAKEAVDKVDAHHIPILAPSMPYENEFRHPHGDVSSLPETVILVNTQNLDKEMIISRRSTYQRILAIEKEGAQVVERDSDLPVDIIINSAICLVWYNCRNIGKKATSSDEASSCLPSCIENIAANVLTLLSFSFSGCIMVFEGEDSFLSTVMEYSDGLYAAAASLGISVQMFCSYSSELTDEIVMNCIGYATRGLYPRMPESETLAESFLTKFPSVNPLTAHAILSSGGMLVDFLECCEEGRSRAVQKYHVPSESIALLGDLCRYGKREDSRSVMTDCSSSVSSGTDSKSLNLNIASKRKRWTDDGSVKISGTHMDDLLHFDSASKFVKETMDPLVEKPYDSFMSKDPRTSREFRNPGQCESNVLHEERELDVRVRNRPYVVSKQNDFQISEEPQTFKKIRTPEFSFNDELSSELQGTDEPMLRNFDLFKTIRKSDFSFNDELSGQLQGTDDTVLKNFNLPKGKSSQVLFDDQKGEVINLTRSPRSQKGFSSVADSISFLMPERDKDDTGKSKTARRLSFGKNRQTNFQTSAEAFSGRDIWNSVEDQRHDCKAGSSNCSDMDFGDDISFIKHPNKLLDDCFKQRSAEKSRESQFQENESSPYRETPLSNALSFSSPGKKSPWTMEFLNRIRDKSRLRHQSLPPDASADSFGFSENVSKYSKRRSPSILEFFKYQGDSTRKVPEQKKQKSLQPARSVKVQKPSASASAQCTYTPQDKRAGKTLSFTRNSGERQTKLVWNDGTHNLSNNFRNQL